MWIAMIAEIVEQPQARELRHLAVRPFDGERFRRG
jgi:hypothetical protein